MKISILFVLFGCCLDIGSNWICFDYMYHHIKKGSVRMSLRLAKNSGKTMKTSVYKVETICCQDRDAITLEGVSSIQQYEEDLMIPQRVKKQ